MKVHVLIVCFVSVYQTVISSRSKFVINIFFRDLKSSSISLITYIKNNMKKMFENVSGGTLKEYISGLYSGESYVKNNDFETKNKKSRSYLKETKSLLAKEHDITSILNKWNRGEDREDPEAESAADLGMQLATPQLALLHGRNMETHVVKTEDGYFLTVHRIPKLNVSNRTVLLHHGLLGSSADWLLLGPTNSLPYILSDAGYDVWIANARGNYYSRGHITLTADSPEYWNFSFQEIGQYDLPAIIDYIRMTRNINETINFIGHSMGATALLVLLSTAPQYNAYLRMGILLAPLAYMNNIQGPMKMMVALSDETLKTLGHGEFLPMRKVPSAVAKTYCRDDQIICSNPLLFLSGSPRENKKWDVNFINQLEFHVPAGGSINTILHYIQLARSRKFHKFNDEASEFMVNNVTLPLVFYSSSDDWLATVPDVSKLYFCIRNPIDHNIIRDMDMSHTDFLWSREATEFIFYDIVKYLDGSSVWLKLIAKEEDDLRNAVY